MRETSKPVEIHGSREKKGKWRKNSNGKISLKWERILHQANSLTYIQNGKVTN